jgi:hypothetical protein
LVCRRDTYDSFIASLQDNPALLAAVARFNAPEIEDFDPQALPARAAALLRNGTLHKLSGSRAGKAITRTWLLQQLGAKGAFTDFSEERRRLALLDKETLSSLALIYGACICAHELARHVRREEVLALRGLLGEQYDYALSRGRFQMRQASEWFAGLPVTKASLQARMTEAGFIALRRCMADWPVDLFRLAAPRLPEALRQADALRLAAEEKSAPMLEVFWADLKKLLLTRMNFQTNHQINFQSKQQVSAPWQTYFA